MNTDTKLDLVLHNQRTIIQALHLMMRSDMAEGHGHSPRTYLDQLPQMQAAVEATCIALRPVPVPTSDGEASWFDQAKVERRLCRAAIDREAHRRIQAQARIDKFSYERQMKTDEQRLQRAYAESCLG